MPGRSGGHNAISIEEHLRRGTFKRSRHGHLLRPSGDDEGWQPTAADLQGLGAAGKRFVRTWLQRYSLSAAEGAVLLEAGWAIERLAALRAQSREGLTLREAGMLARLELGTSKLLAGLLAQLRVHR